MSVKRVLLFDRDPSNTKMQLLGTFNIVKVFIWLQTIFSYTEKFILVHESNQKESEESLHILWNTKQ